ncbi:MAG: hypothetical protein ACI9LM_003974 [Alteromonadaceae bacterium]|jgi:hypothetical protein
MKQKLTNKNSWVAIVIYLTSLSAYAEVTEQIEASAAKIVNINAVTEQTLVNIDDKSFRCIRDMTPVRHFYVDNLLGDIESTLTAANSAQGAKYPVGSVVQLVPTEVMVKRESGVFPATGDWEFFELAVNEKGSKIAKRGFVDVVNRFGGNCFSCHAPAREPWDFICESEHGCEPIPIDHKMTGALQRSDPRCGDAVPEDGDWIALAKLNTMVSIGLIKKWFEDTF